MVSAVHDGDPVRTFVDFLSRVQLESYYGPPAAVDEAIRGALLVLCERGQDEWNRLAGLIVVDVARVPARYVMRAPTLALRTGQTEHLAAGLLAHTLVRRQMIDWRDDLIVFAPYTHAARSLALDPVALYDGAAARAVPALAAVMRGFGRRTDVTLGAFGWRQVESPDGPAFEMLSLRGKPTGAVAGERSWQSVNEARARALLAWVDDQRRGAGADSGS